MKKLLIALSLVGLVSCGSSKSSNTVEHKPLKGNWLYESSTTSASGITFEDSKYTIVDVVLYSDTAGYRQIEHGTYTNTDNTITYTPTYHSCGIGVPATRGYTLHPGNQSLTLQGEGFSILLQRNHATAEDVPKGFLYIEECFE